MKTGYEIAYLEIMPKFRRAVAKELHAGGDSQVTIAKLLGVTQAVVSKYLNAEEHGKTFDKRDLKRFVAALRRRNKSDADRIRCSICLKTRKFDCVFVPR